MRVAVFRAKWAFGKQLYYPINADAKRLLYFSGRIALRDADLRLIARLGFRVDVFRSYAGEGEDLEGESPELTKEEEAGLSQPQPIQDARPSPGSKPPSS